MNIDDGNFFSTGEADMVDGDGGAISAELRAQLTTAIENATRLLEPTKELARPSSSGESAQQKSIAQLLEKLGIKDPEVATLERALQSLLGQFELSGEAIPTEFSRLILQKGSSQSPEAKEILSQIEASKAPQFREAVSELAEKASADFQQAISTQNYEALRKLLTTLREVLGEKNPPVIEVDGRRVEISTQKVDELLKALQTTRPSEGAKAVPTREEFIQFVDAQLSFLKTIETELKDFLGKTNPQSTPQAQSELLVEIIETAEQNPNLSQSAVTKALVSYTKELSEQLNSLLSKETKSEDLRSFLAEQLQTLRELLGEGSSTPQANSNAPSKELLSSLRSLEESLTSILGQTEINLQSPNTQQTVSELVEKLEPVKINFERSSSPVEEQVLEFVRSLRSELENLSPRETKELSATLKRAEEKLAVILNNEQKVPEEEKLPKEAREQLKLIDKLIRTLQETSEPESSTTRTAPTDNRLSQLVELLNTSRPEKTERPPVSEREFVEFSFRQLELLKERVSELRKLFQSVGIEPPPPPTPRENPEAVLQQLVESLERLGNTLEQRVNSRSEILTLIEDFTKGLIELREKNAPKEQLQSLVDKFLKLLQQKLEGLTLETLLKGEPNALSKNQIAQLFSQFALRGLLELQEQMSSVVSKGTSVDGLLETLRQFQNLPSVQQAEAEQELATFLKSAKLEFQKIANNGEFTQETRQVLQGLLEKIYQTYGNENLQTFPLPEQSLQLLRSIEVQIQTLLGTPGSATPEQIVPGSELFSLPREALVGELLRLLSNFEFSGSDNSLPPTEQRLRAIANQMREILSTSNEQVSDMELHGNLSRTLRELQTQVPQTNLRPTDPNVLRAQLDALRGLETIVRGQELLGQMNPLMRALGEPAFILFPSIFHGLLAKIEVAYYPHTVQERPDQRRKSSRDSEEGVQDDVSEEGSRSGPQDDPEARKHRRLQNVKFRVPLPNLGEVEVEFSTVLEEIMLNFRCESFGAERFLKDRVSELLPILEELGLSSVQVSVETERSEDFYPSWLAELVREETVVG